MIAQFVAHVTKTIRANANAACRMTRSPSSRCRKARHPDARRNRGLWHMIADDHARFDAGAGADPCVLANRHVRANENCQIDVSS